MVWLKSIRLMGIFAGAISPAIASMALLAPPSVAQLSRAFQVSLGFPPVQDRGAPARTAGGGVRGGDACVAQGEKPLTALMPTNNVGTTTVEKPTLFLYVPKTNVKAAELSITDKEGNQVVREVPLMGKAGVIEVSMPEKASIEQGKEYHWQFAIVCNSEERSADIYVEGLIERTQLSPELTKEVDAAAPLEKAQILAENKIWLDTLKILAELRSDKPKEWEGLLTSVELDKAIATAPFVNDAQ